METLSVAAANTACIRQSNTYIITVTQSGNGKGISISIKNDTKILLVMKKHTLNHRKKLFLNSCP